MKKGILIISLIAIYSLAACSRQTTTALPSQTLPPTTMPTQVQALDVEQLRNMPITVLGFDAAQNVVLTDGKYDSRDANNPLVVDFGGQFASGDLNGDGIPDAVMVVGANTGGSGEFIQLIAILNRNGAPESAGAVMLGDRVRVTSINIQNNILSIDAFTQGPSDPMSSPSQKIHTTYTLQNDTLVAGEQQIIATGLPQFSDPFAYCAAMGTVDGTEGHYSGPPMTEPIARALIKATGGQESAESLKAFMSNSVFRCVDGQVVACTVGANLPCMDKLNLDQTPAQALLDFCSANSTSDSIPMAVTGHNSAYEWACKDAKPFIVKQIAEPDAQGFTKGIWYPIPPQ